MINMDISSWFTNIYKALFLEWCVSEWVVLFCGASIGKTKCVSLGEQQFSHTSGRQTHKGVRVLILLCNKQSMVKMHKKLNVTYKRYMHGGFKYYIKQKYGDDFFAKGRCVVKVIIKLRMMLMIGYNQEKN